MREVVAFTTSVALHLMAYGGPPRGTQTALNMTAHAIVAADRVVAPEYHQAHNTALEENDGRDGYELAMSRWNSLESALRLSRGLLVHIQVATDTWARVDDAGDFMHILPELLAALGQVIQLMTELGLDVPEEVARIIGILGILLPNGPEA